MHFSYFFFFDFVCLSSSNGETSSWDLVSSVYPFVDSFDIISMCSSMRLNRILFNVCNCNLEILI